MKIVAITAVIIASAVGVQRKESSNGIFVDTRNDISTEDIQALDDQRAGLSKSHDEYPRSDQIIKELEQIHDKLDQILKILNYPISDDTSSAMSNEEEIIRMLENAHKRAGFQSKLDLKDEDSKLEGNKSGSDKSNPT